MHDSATGLVVTDRSATRVERFAWAAAALLFAAHTWLYRYEMVNLDGISYLELAWAWREGRWIDAINGYWSPLYPWLLAIFLAIFDPTPAAEYPIVHVANAAAGLMALGGFAYLVRALRAGDDGIVRMPASLRLGIAYALFIWASIVMLVVWMESPDMLLSAFVFLATGALARVVTGDTRTATFAVFGAAIGLGYLTKSVMLPIGLLFFIALAVAAARRRAWLGVFVAAAITLLIAAPWAITLSLTRGKVTFGETGRINYVWFVNGSENWPHEWPEHWPHWSGDPANGTPQRPARRLSEDPAVYEFAEPVPGTYPMWFDVSQWYEGVRPYFDPADQLRRLKISAADIYAIFALNPYNPRFFNPQPALLGLLLMTAAAMRTSASGRGFIDWWPCWGPAVAAILLYSAVYVEPRYLGAFIVVLWLFAVQSSGSRGGGATDAAILKACGVTMLVILCAAVIAATWIETYPAMRRLLRGEPDREHIAWLTASKFQQEGLRPGDPIAVAGSAQEATRWAHLARVRIIAEVPRSDTPKLSTDAAARETATRTLRDAGVRWLVLEDVGGETPPEWRRVDGTRYLLTPLR